MDLRLLAIYVGPDQVMPVASILATLVGFFLIFWNKLMGFVRKILRLAPPPTEETKLPSPETMESHDPRKRE